MTHIEDDLVMRTVQVIMQGDRQFNDAEIGGKVAAGD